MDTFYRTFDLLNISPVLHPPMLIKCAHWLLRGGRHQIPYVHLPFSAAFSYKCSCPPLQSNSIFTILKDKYTVSDFSLVVFYTNFPFILHLMFTSSAIRSIDALACDVLYSGIRNHDSLFLDSTWINHVVP